MFRFLILKYLCWFDYVMLGSIRWEVVLKPGYRGFFGWICEQSISLGDINFTVYKTSFSNSAAILDGKYKLNKIWPITIFNQLRSPKIQFDYKRRLQVVHLQKSTIYREIKQTSIEGTVKYNLFYIIWKNFIHWSSSFQIDLVNLASCIYDKESSILDKLTLYVKVKLNGLLSKNKVKLNGLSSLLWNLIFQVSNLWQG